MSNLLAQVNLVPNNSFEIYSTCPSSISQISFATDWSSPSPGTPDYYNSCDTTGGADIPYNMGGYQISVSGNAYAGIIAMQAGFSSQREYLQIQLLDSLEGGMGYCLEFICSLGNVSNTAISEMGIYFSDTAISSSAYTQLPVTPQFTSMPGVYLSDTIGWMTVSVMYIAGGGEKYITLGNFKDDASTDTIRIGPGAYSSYYYIDDISVVLCDSTIGISEQAVAEDIFNIYPNPARDEFYVNVIDDEIKEVRVRIKDVTGKVVHAEDQGIVNNSGKFSFDLNNGIYLIELCDVKRNRTKVQKFIVCK